MLRNDTHAYDFNRALYEEIVSAPYFNTDNLNIFCMVDSTAKCTNKLSLSSRVASAVSNISLDPKRMRKVHSDVLSPSLGLAPKNNLHSRAKASPIVKVNVIPSHSNATPVKSPMANGIVGRRLLGAAKPSGNISPNSSTGAKPILSHHHLHHHPLPRSPGVSPRSQDKRLTNLPMDQLAIYFNSDSKFPSIINIARASEAGNEFRATYEFLIILLLISVHFLNMQRFDFLRVIELFYNQRHDACLCRFKLILFHLKCKSFCVNMFACLVYCTKF